MMEWIALNKEWVFSGMGVTAVLFLLNKIFKLNYSDKTTDNQPVTAINNIINNNSQTGLNAFKEEGSHHVEKNTLTIPELKESIRILFIDDDARFKVVAILKNSGWKFTKLIKDVKSLDAPEILESDILFIDIQGVGVALGFNDEGLGLALAVKDKYPMKKVIIYSAETEGNRFHDALRKADSFLAKNADPYEFQRIVEEYSTTLNKNE